MDRHQFIAKIKDIISCNLKYENFFISPSMFNSFIGRRGIDMLCSKITEHFIKFPTILYENYLLSWDDTIELDVTGSSLRNNVVKIRITCYQLDRKDSTWLIEITGNLRFKRSDFYFTTYYGSDKMHIFDFLPSD